MTDADLVAIITGSLGLVGTVLTVLVYMRTGTIRENVANSHTVNMRDDQDQKHDELTSKMDMVIEQQLYQARTTSKLFSVVRKLERELGTHDDRIDQLEDTQSRRNNEHPDNPDHD